MAIALKDLSKTVARSAGYDLVTRAYPHDPIAIVVEEKLYGDNGRRTGRVVGAFDGDALVGVLAQAGRYVKVLAVAPSHRRRGVGTMLLEDARANADAALRVGDHPGNYLSPGVDARYEDGLAFLRARGFTERGRVENLRAIIDDSFAGRRDALVAGLEGYRIQQVDASSRDAVLTMIASQFAPVWAFEASRALDGPRRALYAAFLHGVPVAFAAADGNNQGLGWFGPAGTTPPHRQKKLGEALLLSCLVAVRGLPDAGVIAWIGPKPFYERAIGAVSDRTFVQVDGPS